MITRTDVAKMLDYNVRAGFLRGTREYQPLRAAFVGTQQSTGAFESYADLGDVPWPSQNAGKMGPNGQGADGHSQVTNQVTMGRGVAVIGGEERAMIVYNVDFEVTTAVTHNAINDVRVGNLEEWARGAGRNFEKHQDYLSFDALNKGTLTTTYGACYDGLSFFNALHVDPRAEFQTAQANTFSQVLSLNGFETVRVAAAKFKDSRGQPIGLTHRLLVVPPDLERTAYQIAENPEDYATANRARNPYSGRTTVLVAPGGWLDSTAWFVVDDSQTSKPMYLQQRQAPELTVWDDNLAPDGGLRYFKWHARYAIFYGDWRLAAKGN